MKLKPRIELLLPLLLLFEAYQVTAKTRTSLDTLEYIHFIHEGFKERDLDNKEAAKEAFIQAIQSNPESGTAYLELAKLRIADGDLEDAMQLLEKANELEKNKWQQTLLANLYVLLEKPQKALPLFKSLQDSFPNQKKEYLWKQMYVHQTLKQYKEGIETMDQLEELTKEPLPYMEREKIYFEWGKKKKARKELERLFNTFPETSDLHIQVAGIFFDREQWQQAEHHFKKALSLKPEKQGTIHIALYLLYSKQGRKQEAIQAFRLAICTKGIEEQTKAKLLSTPQNGIDSTRLREIIDTYYDSLPEETTACQLKIRSLFHQGEKEKAQTLLKEILKKKENEISLWQLLIEIDVAKEDYEALKQHTLQSIKLFPDNLSFVIFGLLATAQQEEYHKAIELATHGRKILEKKKHLIEKENYQSILAEILGHMGNAYGFLGNAQNCTTYYDSSLLYSPNSLVTLNNYAYHLSQFNIDLERAERMITLVIQTEVGEKNPNYLDTYAWILFLRKEYSLAKYYMKMAIDNSKDTMGVLLEHYGDILFHNNDKEEALKCWKKALQTEDKDLTEQLEQKIKTKQYIPK